LFCFSDESVVRAIAACVTPTVAAIGHERDQPLIELAADARASTPSTVAQTVLPRRDDVLRAVTERGTSARRAFANRLQRARNALDRIEHRSPVADPARLLQGRRQLVDALSNKIAIGAERRIVRARNALMPLKMQLAASSPQALLERRRARVTQLNEAVERLVRTALAKREARLFPLAGRLEPGVLRVLGRNRVLFETLKAKYNANNHAALLQRGYAVLTAGGRVVRDPADAPPGTLIEAELARGTLRARVERDGADGGEQIKLF
jgi:exodeoxyribonuclease VII large subunit